MEPMATIRSFIVRELIPGRPVHDLGDRSSLLETGILDSLTIMKLISFLETEFSIRMKDEDLTPDNFETLASIVDLVESKSLSR